MLNSCSHRFLISVRSGVTLCGCQDAKLMQSLTSNFRPSCSDRVLLLLLLLLLLLPRHMVSHTPPLEVHLHFWWLDVAMPGAYPGWRQFPRHHAGHNNTVCQRCRWQVTAKYACTFVALHEVTWCMIVRCTQNAPRRQQFYVAPAMPAL